MVAKGLAQMRFSSAEANSCLEEVGGTTLRLMMLKGLPGGCRSTTTNPDKILKKLKKARLQQVKGVVKGKKKRASIQKQGAKHFLKKKKKH